MNYQMMDYEIDMVMCIDVSGSMTPFLDQVKDKVLNFGNMFIEQMQEDRSEVEVTRLRVKVIAFRDYEKDSVPMQESRFFVLPEEEAEFASFVNSLTADGGGDIPENALEALALALKSDWTTNPQKRHGVFMFTDAPALPLGKRAGFTGYPSGMPKDLPQLSSWWHGTDQSFRSNFNFKAGRFIAFVPNAEPWTQLQTWKNAWVYFTQEAGKGLEDVDLATAIDLFVHSI